MNHKSIGYKKLLALMEGLEIRNPEKLANNLSVKQMREFGELYADRAKELIGMPNEGLFHDPRYNPRAPE